MKNTPQKVPADLIGTELRVDSQSLKLTVNTASSLIPFIHEARAAYAAMELEKPFTQELFANMVNGNGAVKAVEEFTEILGKDLKTFSSPVLKAQTLSVSQEFSVALHAAIRKFKYQLESFNKDGGYQLKLTDFNILGNAINLIIAPIREHFTTRITSNGQAAVYSQLNELAGTYNRTVSLLEEHGFTLPTRHTLLDIFFKPEPTGNKDIFQNEIFNNRVLLRKEQITIIK